MVSLSFFFLSLSLSETQLQAADLLLMNQREMLFKTMSSYIRQIFGFHYQFPLQFSDSMGLFLFLLQGCVFLCG